MSAQNKSAATLWEVRRRMGEEIPNNVLPAQRTSAPPRKQARRNAVVIAGEGPPTIYRVYARLSTALAVAGALRWAGYAAKVQRVEASE